MSAEEPFFDLASLAKPLVTAPLALAHLDLEADRRMQLGFTERPEILTVRQLLSHSSGLPPWLPYTGEPLAVQLHRGFPVGAHPLLREASVGVSSYSDLNYRLLAELLELETGRPFLDLANASGLSPAPYKRIPEFVPDGPDMEIWPIVAPQVPIPPRMPELPHDANSRAGMRGHAGFGASAKQLKACLERWLSEGWPSRMAVEISKTLEGMGWGLGLHRAHRGLGRYAELLSGVPEGLRGVQVFAHTGCALAEAAPAEGPIGAPSEWWMHTGFTGPVFFVRPTDGCCIAILCHRRGPMGELLDVEQLRARRWMALKQLLNYPLPSS